MEKDGIQILVIGCTRDEFEVWIKTQPTPSFYCFYPVDSLLGRGFDGFLDLGLHDTSKEFPHLYTRLK